jgi:hypothetical protein
VSPLGSDRIRSFASLSQLFVECLKPVLALLVQSAEGGGPTESFIQFLSFDLAPVDLIYQVVNCSSSSVRFGQRARQTLLDIPELRIPGTPFRRSSRETTHTGHN